MNVKKEVRGTEMNFTKNAEEICFSANDLYITNMLLS